MFDILITLYDFITGLGYFAYSVVSSFDSFVTFLISALPYSVRFLSVFSGVPLFVAIASLTIGARLVRFIRGVS